MNQIRSYGQKRCYCSSESTQRKTTNKKSAPKTRYARSTDSIVSVLVEGLLITACFFGVIFDFFLLMV